MGRVVVSAVIESLEDCYLVHRGQMPAEQVRRVEIADALVDSASTGLSLPKRMVAQLGLMPIRSRLAVTTVGFEVAQLSVLSD